MASHCLPNGQLGTNELPVPNISGATMTTFNPPTGMLRRGVVVFMHGLYVAAIAAAVPPSTLTGGPVGDNYGAFGSVYGNSLCTNLANDGWVVLAVTAQEDTFAGVPSTGVYNDVAADSGYGVRYQNSTLRTWDHVVSYIQQTYGDWPIIAAGFSVGGWRATTIAQARPQTVKAVISHQPASVFENVATIFTPGANFGLVNWSGADDVGTELNGISCPALVGYSSGDNAVWYAGNSTVATINGGTTGIAAASVTAMTVTGGTTNFFGAGAGNVTLTGLTGGTSQGRATYAYTTYSAGSFTGMTLVGGSGTVPVGAVAVQGYTDTICTNAVAAGKSVTRNQGIDVHSLSLGFTGAYYTGTGLTLVAGANTGLTVPITAAQAATPLGATQGLLAGACAIQDNAGVWRPITAIGGITTPNLTGVTITGPGSGTATIATNAPICNTGTAITGGYSNMAIPYWVNTVIDPSYPKTY
jgi:hypothetical protein